MANLNLGLLQALADPLVHPVEPEPEPEFSPTLNPAVEALLADAGLSPEVKRSLRANERVRNKRDRLQFEISKLKTRDLREKQSQEKLLTTIGGVPLGFQVGTYAGIENPVARFLVDVVADPVNLLGGIGIGSKFGITGLGRAAKQLKGMKPGVFAQKIAEGAEFMAKAKVHEDIADELLAATKLDGAARGKAVMKAFKKSKKRPLTDDMIKSLEDAGVDDEFLRILRNPSKETQGIQEALSLADDATVETFKSTYIERLAAGQQGLLRFDIPFMNRELGSIGLPKFMKSLTGDLKPASAIKDDLAAATRETTKGLKSVFRIREEMVKNASKDSFNPRNTAALAASVGDAFNIVKEYLDPATGISRMMDTSIAKEDLVGQVLRGEANTRWLSEMSPAQFTRNTMIGIESMSEIAESSMKVAFSEDQRKFITKILERTVSFDEMHDFWETLDDGQLMIVDIIDEFYKSMGDIGVRSGALKDTIKELFVPHVYRFKNGGAEHLALMADLHVAGALGKDVPKAFAKYAPKPGLPKAKHGLRRTIQDLDIARKWMDDHPELGGEIVEDIAGITGAYTRSTGASILRNNLIQSLKVLKVTDDGLPMAISKRKALSSVEDDVVEAVVAKGSKAAGKKVDTELEAGARILAANSSSYEKLSGDRVPDAIKDIYFHKDVIQDVRTFYSQDFVKILKSQGGGIEKVTDALDRINSAGKAALFNLLPFFHAASLTYSNFALLPPAVAFENSKDLWKATGRFIYGKISPKHRAQATDELLNVWSRSMSGLKNGDGEILTGRDLLDQYFQSGLRRGRVLDDTGYGVVDQMLRGVMESGLPKPLRAPAGFAKGWNDLSDATLWSIMHEGYQLSGWVHLRNKFLREAPAGTYAGARKMLELNSEVGRIVQQAYGGILDRLVLHPTTRKAARHAFLAPDWTLSNFMMARDLFFNAPIIRETGLAQKFTKDALLKDVRFQAALGYNTRAALYSFLLGNTFNYMFTAIKDGKGRFMWEDDSNKDPVTGLHTRVELPYNRADGRKQYMDVTKQFAEPLKLMLKPSEFFKGKMGVLPRVLGAGVIGVDSFGRKINGGEGIMQQELAQIAEATGQFAPIPVQSAGQALQGHRDPRSSVLSTLSGFSIRSEDIDRFDRRNRLNELREKMNLELMRQ